MIEKIKKLTSEQSVMDELDKMSFKEFLEFFKKIDETIKTEKSSQVTFNHTQIAKICLKYGFKKITDDFSIIGNPTINQFLELKDKKRVVRINDLEEHFKNKDDQYIRDMFEIYGRKQLASIQLNDELKEIKNEHTKMNNCYSKLVSKITKIEYEISLQFILATYKIAKRKIQEHKMLFTFNGDVFFQKSKGKNIIEFNQNKKNTLIKIKQEIKKVDKNLEKKEKISKLIEIYQQGFAYNYDYEYKVKSLKVQLEYLKTKDNLEKKYNEQIEVAKTKLDVEKKHVAKYKKHDDEKLNLLRVEYKSKVYYAATKNELKEIKQTYKQDRIMVKESNVYNKAKSDYRYKNHLKKVEQKKCKIEYISNVENINNSLPTEIKKWRVWLCPILSIIPGLGQLICKQYKKGILMMCSLLFLIVFLLYGFGLGNIRGNGIFGLIDFGAKESDTDGRFHMIEGIVSIILISVSLIIILLSVFDAKRTVKQQNIGVRARNWSQTNEFLKNQGTPYLLSLPAIIGILFIVLVPIIATVIIAFTNYGRGNDPARPGQVIEWIGFDNFVEIFGGRYSSSFGYVMLWTFSWVLFASVGSIFAGTTAALMVNNDRLKFKGFFRLFLILPWAVPAFIMIMMFSLLFSNSSFNEFTQKFFGVSGWTNQQTQARVALIFIQTWLGQSYMFLLITGILQGVSKDIYDASSMDGASKFKQTIRLTLPIVFGQIAPLILGQFTFNFGNFGIISLYGANGVALGPDGLPYPGEPGITDILISFVYKLSTNQTSYAYGIAAAFVIVSSTIVVTISAVGFKNMKAFKN